MTGFERPKSLTELVTQEIRDQIVNGRVELGGSLSEGRFAKELGVSRTPVREAFNRLEMEGLVRTEPQRGTFVFSLGTDELAKICDVRVCLETTALRFAFAADADRLHECLTDCTNAMTATRSKKDDEAYLREDTRFHQCLFDCANNRFLNDAYQAIAAKMAALRHRLGRHPDHMAKSYMEHLEIAQAIADGDLKRAEKILKFHIGRKEGSYWQLATGQEESVPAS